MHWKFIAPCAVALMMGAQVSAWATPIFITNAGFEDPPTSGVNVGLFTGWNATGSGAGVWNINAAPLGYWNTSAPEGNQIAYVGRENPSGTPASISQILGDTVQADSVYTLTGQVGHPIGYGSTPDPDTVYTVELLAGNVSVSLFSGTGLEGAFSLFQLTFDSTGSAFVGQALQIRLSSSKTQTAFDDIRLDRFSTAASVPEPSTLFLVAVGGFGLMHGERLGARRRRSPKCEL